MRIAFQELSRGENKQRAEAELALRMLSAVQAIGTVEAIASSNMDEIALFEPDVVIPLHMFLPKLFDAFTVGCIWEPVRRIKRNSSWDQVKSYDGYGVTTDKQEQFIRALKFRSPQPYLLSKIYPSTNTTVFKKPEAFSKPVYIGSGWFKDRHRDLFSSANNISVYGPKNSWDYLADSIYCGEIPIDGRSSLEIYHKAGVGLSLHHEHHNLEGIPSMRPFEIAASSSVIISDLNAFVQEAFGETALYLDTSLEPGEINEQLKELTDWIQNHKNQAQEMAEASHKIFVEKYSLEILLKNLISDIAQFTNDNNLPSAKALPEVEIIVMSDGEEKKKMFSALKSIDDQSYNMVSALLIYSGMAERLQFLQQEIQEKFPDLRIKYISANKECGSGSKFFTGLRASTAPYIGFLNFDELLFSDHVSVLLDGLSKYPDAPLAYSGSIRIWEGENPLEGEQIRNLAYFYEVDRGSELESFISSNSFIVRRESIPWNVFNQPIPNMDGVDDSIFLYMVYRTNPNFLFSEKVTSAFFQRAATMDNSAYETRHRTKNNKVFGIITHQCHTKSTYGESTVNKHPDNSRLESPNFIRKFLSVLRNDIAIIVARLKGKNK